MSVDGQAVAATQHNTTQHIGIMPDLGFLSDTGRTGVKYLAKENGKAPKEVKSLRISSFFSKGPSLFNLLPAALRQPARPKSKEEAKKLLDKFKKWLDKWLELIPDQPTTDSIPNDRRGAIANTLVEQMRANKLTINRQWDIVQRKLEEEERNNENAFTHNATSGIPS